jgi:hypothetical protein
MPTNDEIVRMMLGQQPAVFGPLQQAPQQPQLPPELEQHFKNIEDFWARNPSATSTRPATTPADDIDHHMENIKQFWANNPPPQMAPQVQFGGPPTVAASTPAVPTNRLTGRTVAGVPLDERGRPVVELRDVTPGHPEPAYSATRQYFNGIRNDLAGASPWDLLEGASSAAGFAGEAGAFNALSGLDKAGRALVGRELRSYTEGGAAKNAMQDAQSASRQAAEAAQPMTDAKDYAQLPPHIVQQRDAKTGRFGSIPADVKAAREAGRQRLELERRANEKYPTMYDENGEWSPPPGWSDVIDKID